MPRDDGIFFRTIAEHQACALWVGRYPSGEVVFTNEAYAVLMGTAQLGEGAVGEHAAMVLLFTRDGAPYPVERMGFGRAGCTKAAVTVDDVVIHKNDQRIFLRSTFTPVLEDSGEVSHIIVTLVDITREVLAEQALQRGERAISIGTLAGGIAHNFNNVLATVRGIASVLQAEDNDRQRRADLSLLEEAAAQGAGLTRALLEYTRRRPGKCLRTTLDAAAASVVAILAGTIDRRIKIALELHAQQEVEGDLALLEQLVMNLVVNACEALPQGGGVAVRTLDVTLADGTSGVALEVADTGSGIDSAILDLVVEPSATSKSGAGRGLASALRIVQGHAGSLAVQATGPSGTTMRATLPALASLASAGEAEGVPAHTVPPAADADAEALLPGGGLVLVIDDEAVVREITRRQLQSLGYAAVTAANGDAALAILERLRPHVRTIVLDMNMPGRGGIDVLPALLALAPGLRVLMISGSDPNDDERSVIQSCGVFLGKPWSVAELSQALTSLTRSHSSRAIQRRV